MKGLEMGSVETLIIWENLDTIRYELKKPGAELPVVLYLRPDQEKTKELFTDPDVSRAATTDAYLLIHSYLILQTGTEMEVQDKTQLIEWLAINYKRFGTVMEIVTDRTQEGAQFCAGFGGIGGLLRYRVDFQAIDEDMPKFDIDLDDLGL